MKKINKRAVVSILLFVSLIIMPITGWLGHNAGSTLLYVHTVSGFIFVICSIFHLVWNWKIMKRYLTGKTK